MQVFIDTSVDGECCRYGYALQAEIKKAQSVDEVNAIVSSGDFSKHFSGLIDILIQENNTIEK